MPAATTPARIVDGVQRGAGGDPHVVACLTREAQAQDDGANSCNEERSVDHRVTAVAEEHGEHEDRGGRGDGLGHRPESERSPVGEHCSPPERKPCRGDEAPEGLDRCLLEFEGVPRRFEVGAQQIQRLAGRDDRSRCLGKQDHVADDQHARRTDHSRDPHPETSAPHNERKEVGGDDEVTRSARQRRSTKKRARPMVTTSERAATAISVATSVIRRGLTVSPRSKPIDRAASDLRVARAGQVNPLAGADRSCCRSSPGVGIDRDDDGRSEPHSEAAASGDIRGEDWIGGHGDDRAGPLGIPG